MEPCLDWPIQGKECSSDVSSRFFWVERCVTAQKTAARETTAAQAIIQGSAHGELTTFVSFSRI